jgi:hypothetical protein
VLFCWAVVRNFIPKDSWSVRDKSLDDISLKSQRQIEIRPGLISIFKNRKPEYEIMNIFKIALALAFVTQAKHHIINLYVSQCHEIGSTRHHLREVIRGRISFGIDLS